MQEVGAASSGPFIRRHASTVSPLHMDGSLSDDEFHGLKLKIIATTENQKKAVRSASNASVTFGVIVAALIGLIVVDHLNGSLLPDPLYCAIGAGFSVMEPGRTEANAWSANNGCGAYRPECATSWTNHPPANRCVHGTVWEAIQTKFKSL